MSAELKLVIEWINGMYREIGTFSDFEKQLIENLACTVEHFEKSVH